MKIAYILDSFPSISETFILNQITGLIDLGHNVGIFAFHNPNEEKVHHDVMKYRLFDKVTYFDIPEQKLKRIIKALSIVSHYLLFFPCEIIKCLNFKKYEGKYYALNNLFKLSPFLKKRYDVIHCHFGTTGKELIFLKDIFPNCKFIVSFHGWDITSFVNKNGTIIYNNLFRKGDLFLPISLRWKEKLEKLKCDSKKIMVHRMGIDTKNLQYRINLPVNSSLKVITIARLVEKKGLEYSVEAISRLARKYQNIEYLIIGDGPLKESLRNLIVELRMVDKIRILGWLDKDSVKKELCKSHIFMLTSITTKDGDQEGVPVSLMEAMAMGLPVISTYHSGIPELICDGKTGFLVKEKDVESTAKKLEYLINNQHKWTEITKTARQFVEENFNITKLNRQLVQIYEYNNIN